MRLVSTEKASKILQVVRLLLSGVAIIGLSVVLQLIATQFGWVEASKRTGAQALLRISRADYRAVVQADPEILYFGDSTVFSEPTNEDRLCTSDELQALLPGREVVGFHGVALPPEFFAVALDYFVRNGCRPEVVIAPVNIRALSTAFREDPRFRIGDALAMAEHDGLWFRAFFKPLKASGVLDRRYLSPEDYYVAVLREASGEPAFEAYRSSKPEFMPLNDLRGFGFYGIALRPDNPGLEGLQRMHETCRKIGAEFVCYVTPVDFGNIERRLGEGGAATARANTRFAVAWLEERGIPVLDLSESLDAEAFYITNISSSHLLKRGRRFVAEQLSLQLHEEETPDDAR